MTDMDTGWRLEYPASSYPRFRYFQHQLHLMVPRWKRIMESLSIDAECFPDCIVHGKESLEHIIKGANLITNRVTVNVFGGIEHLQENELEVAAQTDRECIKKASILTKENAENELEVEARTERDCKQKASNLLEEYVENLQKTLENGFYEPSVTIFVVPTGHIQVKVIESRLSGFWKERLHSAIVYIADTKMSYLYLDLKAVNFDTEGIVSSMDSKPLAKQIEYILEKKVVDVLESIADINLRLIQTKISVKESVEDRIKQRLQNCDHSAAVLDIFDDKSMKEEANQSGKTTKGDLIKYVWRLTRCVTVETLSQKYGMSAQLVNVLLAGKCLDFDMKVWKETWSSYLSKWSKKRLNTIRCKKCMEFFASNMTSFAHEAEAYIQNKNKTLVLVRRLQFELDGLLRKSRAPKCLATKTIPKLPRELQVALLQIQGVYGCGIIWGELVLHVTQPPSDTLKKAVNECLAKFKYSYTYQLRVSEPLKDHARVTVEQGTGIRAKRSTTNAAAQSDRATAEEIIEPNQRSEQNDSSGEHSNGSLGCFVNVIKTRTENMITSKELFAITCAHCLDNCDEKVEWRMSQVDDTYGILGYRTHVLYNSKQFDVATIKIESSAIGNCSTELKSSESSEDKPLLCSMWSFHDSCADVDGEPVYKHGGTSGLTRGTCISDSYEIEQRLQRFKQSDVLDAEHIVLISPLSDVSLPSDTQGVKFSKPGDSGSVACEDEMNRNCVSVLCLVRGEITVKAEPETGEPEEVYSYASPMKKTIEELERTFNISIRPASESDSRGPPT